MTPRHPDPEHQDRIQLRGEFDPTRLIDSRFISIENRLQDVHETGEETRLEVGVLKNLVNEMVYAFKSFRTAMYTTAGAVVTAAILIVLFHKP